MATRHEPYIYRGGSGGPFGAIQHYTQTGMGWSYFGDFGFAEYAKKKNKDQERAASDAANAQAVANAANMAAAAQGGVPVSDVGGALGAMGNLDFALAAAAVGEFAAAADPTRALNTLNETAEGLPDPEEPVGVGPGGDGGASPGAHVSPSEVDPRQLNLSNRNLDQPFVGPPPSTLPPLPPGSTPPAPPGQVGGAARPPGADSPGEPDVSPTQSPGAATSPSTQPPPGTPRTFPPGPPAPLGRPREPSAPSAGGPYAPPSDVRPDRPASPDDESDGPGMGTSGARRPFVAPQALSAGMPGVGEASLDPDSPFPGFVPNAPAPPGGASDLTLGALLEGRAMMEFSEQQARQIYTATVLQEMYRVNLQSQYPDRRVGVETWLPIFAPLGHSSPATDEPLVFGDPRLGGLRVMEAGDSGQVAVFTEFEHSGTVTLGERQYQLVGLLHLHPGESAEPSAADVDAQTVVQTPWLGMSGSASGLHFFVLFKGPGEDPPTGSGVPSQGLQPLAVEVPGHMTIYAGDPSIGLWRVR